MMWLADLMCRWFGHRWRTVPAEETLLHVQACRRCGDSRVLR